MSVDTRELEAEVVSDLKIELSSDPTFNEDILAVKVKLVVKELINRINYSATSWSDEKIADDLRNYYSVICNVARYDYNQIGAEGESAHSENGVSRTYVSRNTLFKGVHAFVNVF